MGVGVGREKREREGGRETKTEVVTWTGRPTSDLNFLLGEFFPYDL